MGAVAEVRARSIDGGPRHLCRAAGVVVVLAGCGGAPTSSREWRDVADSGGAADALEASVDGGEDAVGGAPRPSELWIRTYDGGGGDWGSSVATDPDGNVLVIGTTQPEVPGGTNIWTRKYDPSGAELWTRTFDGGGNDQGYGIATDAAGNVVVVGTSDTTTGRGWVRKYDPEGNELWTRTYDGGAGIDVAVDAAGNVCVTGRAEVMSDIWIGKYDPSGTELWRRTYDSGGDDFGNGIATDGAGNVMVVGTIHNGDAQQDIWIGKYDANGADVWTRTYDGGSREDRGFDVAVDGSDHVLVVGHTQLLAPSGGPVAHRWLRKYDAAGADIWTRTRALGAIVYPSMAASSAGEFVVTGLPWLTKYDAAGDELWTIPAVEGLTDPPFGPATSAGVALDADGTIVVTGSVHNRNYDSTFVLAGDVITMKYVP